MKQTVLFVLGTLFAAAAPADEAAIRKVLESKYGVRVEGIQPAPVNGLYEVRARSSEGLRIVYTDAGAEHLILGNIVETGSDRNLTNERMRKLTAIDFRKLPLGQAIKIQRGNGRRVMAMFSDPYCPACRQFERVLRDINDVTIYVFMYPVIRPENIAHSRAVWCASDRALAWLDLAARDKPKIPATGADCANPVDKVIEYGRSIGVNSTPTLFFANGERVAGGLAPEDLIETLDQIAAAQASVKPN